jgi:acetyltransferase-like isoleucine patch superfamily enzyme
MKAWIKRNYYRLYYYNKKVKIGHNVLLNIKNTFEGLNTIGKNCEIATCTIGLGSYVSDNSVIKNVLIGRFCSIGSNVQTYLGLHPSKIFVSTHPAFFSSQKPAGFSFANENVFEEHIFIYPDKKYVVEIGNDVWVGNNVTILDGLKIGDGAIIAAGSIVTKDILPYSIVGGIPAKLMRFRFTEDQIKKMLVIKWWNWDFNRIKASSKWFNNIESFISFAENQL